MPNSHLKNQLIRYLDQSNDLERLKFEFFNYQKLSGMSGKDFNKVFRFTLPVDFPLLADISGEAAELIVEEPDEGNELFQQVIQQFVTVLEFNSEMNKVQLRLRLNSVPHLRLLELSQAHILPLGLFNVRGILATQTTPIKYLESAVLQCSDCGTKIRVTEVEPVRCDCGAATNEVTRARIYREKVMGVLIDKESFTMEMRRHQGLLIEFPDDIYPGIELGNIYNVTVKRNGEKLSAEGIHPLGPQSNLNPNPKLLPVISSIMDLNSPWAIVNYLACQITTDLFPLTSFIHLKTGLLLSLGTTGTKYPIPILGLGECHAVMSSALKLSKRPFSPTVPLCSSLPGTITEKNGVFWLEAGPLLLASNGTLFIGNLPKPGSTHFSQMCNFDSEIVTMPHKTSSTKDLKTYKLEASVWTYWSSSSHSAQEMKLLRNLIDTFGMPFFAKIGPDDESVAKAMLNPTTYHFLDQKELREFIGFVASKQIKMSQAASDIIRDYFVASRLERPECLPVKTIKVVTGLSESHARLSLRSSVLVEDALAAIFLYEESVNALFGPSLWRVPPERVTNAANQIEYAQKMDQVMRQFSQWMDSYLKTFTKESNI